MKMTATSEVCNANKETLDGPWKVVSCGNDTLGEVLNDFVAAGYLIHSIHPIYKPLQRSEEFTVCGIEQKFVQPANLLTEEQANEIKEKMNEANNG